MIYHYTDYKNIHKCLSKCHYIHHIINLNQLIWEIKTDLEINKRYLHKTSSFLIRRKKEDYSLVYYRAIANRIELIGY